jgi:hypothetical protein
MVMLVKPELLKVLSPMLSTLLGMVMLFKLFVLLNALSPMLVTVLGIVMFVSLVAPVNA